VIAVREAPAEHYDWIARRAGLIVLSDFRAIEAVDGDRIVGMVGYDDWTPNACSMHVAVDHPVAIRRLLRDAFAMPFAQLGFGVVFGRVLSTNKAALKLDIHLGFKEVCFLSDAWAVGVGIHVLEMRREECRWIGR
jgi:RimJ/RimL family protein N-acetyltransferase